MVRILSVLPHAGGNVAPTLEILRELARRGGEVVVLGHVQLASAVEAAGHGFRAFRHARPWSATVERPGWRSMIGWLPLASDRGVGRDIAEVGGRAGSRADPRRLHAARRAPRCARDRGDGRDGDAHDDRLLGGAVGPPHSARTVAAPHGHPPEPARVAPDLALLATMPEFDPLPERTRIRATADRADRTRRRAGRSPRAARGPGRPTVLISLSTISYPGQGELLQAAGGCGRRAARCARS